LQEIVLAGDRSLQSPAHCADTKRMDISAIALQGLQQAETQLENAATVIASAGANSASPDAVDLTVEMTALMSARNQSAVNLSVLKTADEMQKATIDLMA
jgi:hypothetical protein